MPITTQSADGMLHQFPDGTPDAVIDKAMKAYAAENAPKPKPNSLIDAARSVPGGLAKFAGGVAGLPGDIGDVLKSGFNYALDSAGRAIVGDSYQSTPLRPSAVGSGSITNAIAKPFGGLYQPQTTAGRYAETIASFAPAAALPGSILARTARVVVPGAASETGGEIGQEVGGDTGETIGRVGGALVGGSAIPITRAATRAVGGLANRASESLFNVPLRDPTAKATEAIRTSIAHEGGTAPITQRLNDWAASGASNPALIDVSGNATRRLVRSAAGGAEGDAQNLAQSYADQIAGNLQERAVGHARALTPETRPAETVASDLETRQNTEAAQNYAPMRMEPTAVTREMVSALQGPEGAGAIRRAYVAARARRDLQQMGELQDLLKVAEEQGGGTNIVTGKRQTLAQALSQVSAGSLDRVRIAMRERGRGLYESGARDIAGGYRDRVRDIDTALDQSPTIGPARANYRDFQAQRDALEAGRGAVNTPADEYGLTIQDLATRSPQARQAAGVGYARAIQNQFERGPEGATGAMNRIATSTQQSRNLAETYGQPTAERFQAAVGNEAQRLRNARFINPNTGSQTEPRLAENLAVNLASGRIRMWEHVADLLGRSTLTARERAELVRLGTSEADLRRIISNLPRNASRAQIAQQLAISAGLGASNPGRQP